MVEELLIPADSAELSDLELIRSPVVTREGYYTPRTSRRKKIQEVQKLNSASEETALESGSGGGDEKVDKEDNNGEEDNDVAVPWAFGSCVSVPMGGIDKNYGIWEGGGVRAFRKMGWWFRAVVVVAALIDLLVRFLCKKEGKGGICFFLLRVGFSSMMG
jgi:hypothetical protein